MATRRRSISSTRGSEVRPSLALDWTDGTSIPEIDPAQPSVIDSAKRKPLTIRTVEEILEMKFDDADLILGNGYLASGERTAICGMGGVGKARLVMQLALCCRAGRQFLGWETRGTHLRWLFLQTEN